MTGQKARDDERLALEEWSSKHRSVLSMRDGSIASCTCMDGVFIDGHEDWDQHIAGSLIAAGYGNRPDPALVAHARSILVRADEWRRPNFPTEASESLDAVSNALEWLLRALTGERKHPEPEFAESHSVITGYQEAYSVTTRHEVFDARPAPCRVCGGSDPKPECRVCRFKTDPDWKVDF